MGSVLITSAKRDDGKVIENKWTMWSSVVGNISRGEAARAQIAVQDMGAKIKARLGLREDPFQFVSSALGMKFRAVGVAGSLSINEVTIDVVPKFVFTTDRLVNWNNASLFLLEGLGGKNALSLLAERRDWKSHRITDLLAHAFCDSAEKALRDQVIHTYQLREETSVVLRGRLNISRQLRTIVTSPHLLQCDVDQLDARNPFNNVLKWAAITLSRSCREQSLKQRLEEVARALPGDPDASASFRHLKLVAPPQFQSWANPLELARLLANGTTLPVAGARRSGYSLMFNMERAFERFVEVGLSRAFQIKKVNGISSRRQQRTAFAKPEFGEGKTIVCIPDNVIHRDERPIIVVDAKYKLLDTEFSKEGTSAPQSSDVYELVAGMVSNRCTLGMLVYPISSDAASVKIRSWTVEAFDKKLRIGAIGVNLMNLTSRVALSKAHSELAEEILKFEK